MVNRIFTAQEGLPNDGTAFGHRNTLPPRFHTPVGLSSKAIEDFIDLQLDTEDPAVLAKEFPAETASGWHGYVEWEREPERCIKAEKILASKIFTPFLEFQVNELPKTNPLITDDQFKECHLALGPNLENMPAESWAIAQEEKSKDMLTVLDFPLNVEPHRDQLMKSAITPNELHFVRNHGGIPTIKDEDYILEIGGLIGKPGKLTLAQIKDPNLFPQIEVPITLQCCGTRRVEQIAYASGDPNPLLSAPWAEGAIGTAVYKGVSLKRVLKYMGGVTQEYTHVEGIGADTYFKGGKLFNYAVSVPFTKVRVHEVILAYEMNGVPLPKCHGGPLRMVVAGYIGARSCKWLIRLNVLADASNGPVQRQEYLYFNQQVGKHNFSYSSGFSINAMPVSSAILFPADKAVIIHKGFVQCSGWAYSGNGNWVERVEVSSDGGFTWFQVPNENLSEKHYHTKRLWHMDLPVQAEGWLEVVVRCWDSSCNTQPLTVREAWNWTLHVTSHAHRIKIYSADTRNKATSDRLALLEKHGDSLIPITRLSEGVPIETLEAYTAAMKIRGPREPRS